MAARIANLPPASSLFATFLGYNPIAHLLHGHLATIPHAQVAILTGHSFFPRLITAPFASALSAAFTFAMIVCLLAAGASVMRGGRYRWGETDATAHAETPDASDSVNARTAAAVGASPPDRIDDG